MFDMGLSEILLIAVIAVIAIGPDKLPETMGKIAKIFKSFRGSVDQVKQSIDQELQVSEMKKEAMEYRAKYESMTNQVSNDINNIVLDDDDIKVKSKQPTKEA